MDNTHKSRWSGMNIALWVAQILLAIVFLFSGWTKLYLPVEQLTAGSSLPGFFFRFIGVMEMAGAFGMILPGALCIKPLLTPLAAMGFVIIMIGAVIITITGMGFSLSLIPLAIGLLAAFVAYGRLRIAPLCK